MIFEVKRYRRRLHLHDFLVADGKAVLLALIENIRKIRNEISELLHEAVGLLVVGELATYYHSAYDAPRTRNIFRASANLSYTVNRCDYEGRT